MFTQSILLVLGLSMSSVASATTYAPQTPGDGPSACWSVGPGLVHCDTLRGALSAANAAPGSHTIDLAGGSYILNQPGYDNANVQGDLDIVGGSNITIMGPGVIDAGPIPGGDRVLDVHFGATLLVVDTVLLNGMVDVALTTPKGGGIYNRAGGTTTLQGSTVTNNTVHGMYFSDGGGGIANDGVLRVYGTDITNNSVLEGSGAGLFTFGGSAYIQGSQITNNTGVDARGGGVAALGSFDLLRTNIEGNSASFEGGGLYVDNTTAMSASIEYSSIVGNSTTSPTIGHGAGLFAEGTATHVEFHTSTIGKNFTLGGWGGGVRATGGATVTFESVTIAENVEPSFPSGIDCSGGICQFNRSIVDDHCFTPAVSLGVNLDSTAISGCAFTNVVPGGALFAPMGLAGTWAYPLTSGSAALDLATGCAPTDQHGNPRGNPCDVGSMEF